MKQLNKVFKISYVDRGDKKRHHIFIEANDIKIQVVTEDEIKESCRKFVNTMKQFDKKYFNKKS